MLLLLVSSSTRRGFLWRQRWWTVVVVVVVVVIVVVVVVVVVFLYKEGIPVEAKVVGMGTPCFQIELYHTSLHLTPTLHLPTPYTF